MIQDILKTHILLLDGAMGSLIQRLHLKEEDFRCDELASHPVNLLGNYDVLNITKPEIIKTIHKDYIDAG